MATVQMDKRNLTLLTDLYQLTMMNGYFKESRKDEIAVFDVFFRQNGMITYSIACGFGTGGRLYTQPEIRQGRDRVPAKS